MGSDEEHGDLVAIPAIDGSLFDKLNPSRFDSIYLFYEKFLSNAHRYKLTVVDRSLLPSSKCSHITAVFLIPAGRETEYIFSSQRGLLSVAESANCARLIAVAFGRQHVFESQQAVQDELTFVVQVLSRQGHFLPPALYKRHATQHVASSIPFMALDGIGSRNVIAEGKTNLSGSYLVEQVKADNGIVRRLYFMDNPFVIQSEVTLLEKYRNQDQEGRGDSGDEDVNKSILSFDYHKHVAAGIMAIVEPPAAPAAATAAENEETSLLKTELAEPQMISGAVIGLGGGGLTNFLQHVLPSLALTVLELDESVVEIAERYFGLKRTENLDIRIGDGLLLDIMQDPDDDNDHNITPQPASKSLFLPPESQHFVVVDVDSKDKTVGMSCPPAEFIEIAYLLKVKSILQPHGLLVINVSARDPVMFAKVKDNVKAVFDLCFLYEQDTDHEERQKDVNVVLFACSGEGGSSTMSLPSKLKRIEAIHNMLRPFVESNKAVSSLDDASWKTTLSELEESVAGWTLFDKEEKPVAKQRQSGGSNKKGRNKKKKGKQK